MHFIQAMPQLCPVWRDPTIRPAPPTPLLCGCTLGCTELPGSRRKARLCGSSWEAHQAAGQAGSKPDLTNICFREQPKRPQPKVQSFWKVFQVPLCTFWICEDPKGGGIEKLSRLTAAAELSGCWSFSATSKPATHLSVQAEYNRASTAPTQSCCFLDLHYMYHLLCLEAGAPFLRHALWWGAKIPLQNAHPGALSDWQEEETHYRKQKLCHNVLRAAFAQGYP